MIHFDQARHACLDAIRDLVASEETIQRAVLIDDIFGRIRVVAWIAGDAQERLRRRIDEELSKAGGPFWSGDVWMSNGTADPDEAVYEAAWEQAVEVSVKLRLANRFRSKGFWLTTPDEPAWPTPRPPVIAFYSFKGGVGRTTAAASFAIQRARAGERVAVVDLDLEAPGIGTLLDPGEGLPGAEWGVLDYLLERPVIPERLDLRDYYHACAREAVTGSGEILVIPAGRQDSGFLAKLSRVDLEPPPPLEQHPLLQLLEQVRDDLQPQWILLDCRAGISEAAGFVLSGLSHLTVLFGTTSEQSWLGLRIILERLGKERVLQGRPQLECLLVHAMAPADPETRSRAEADFGSRSEDEFTDSYYASDPPSPEEDDFWYVRDKEDEFAPHSPASLPYKSELAFVKSIDTVADALARDADYQNLAKRIAERFSGPDDTDGLES
ncbi:MAG: tyrosine-protein kinase family protein [Bryobacteraceae bacterium]